MLMIFSRKTACNMYVYVYVYVCNKERKTEVVC
jgi:hypothetical protein